LKSDQPIHDNHTTTTVRNQPVASVKTATVVRQVGYSEPPPGLLIPSEELGARDRVRRRRVRSRRGGEWAWVIVAMALLGIVIVLGMTLSLLIRAVQERPETIPTAAAVLPTPLDVRASFSGAAGDTQVMLSDGRMLALTPWNGVSRFTILVMGLDRRPGESGLAYRTDTIMLVSLDPATNSIGILSVPRDLYVEVPGYNQLQRINTTLVLGELRQPDFGPQLAMQTVQYNLGIRIHDFVAVDFQAFIKFIDALGGLEIDIPYNISDPLYPDMNYGYDPFYIRAGKQILNGATALKYARTRHGDSDFQRAQRQQLVLYAIRDQLLDADRLPQLIVQSPNLWEALRDGIYTGITIDQAIQLALYLKDIPAENIRTGVINEGYTVGYRTADGAQVLVPDRARLGLLMSEVFGPDYFQ
jgi:LCP family protein required for cell wall assembly